MTATIRLTREQVEGIASAACDAAYSRAVAVLLAPDAAKFADDPNVQAAIRDDREARNRLRVALDATFAELDRLRAAVNQ